MVWTSLRRVHLVLAVLGLGAPKVATAQWLETVVYSGSLADGVVSGSSGMADGGIVTFAYDVQTDCPGIDCARTLYLDRWDGAFAGPVAQAVDARPDLGDTHVHGYMPVLVSDPTEPTLSAFVHLRRSACRTTVEVGAELLVDKATLLPVGTALPLDRSEPCVDTGVQSAFHAPGSDRWVACWTAVTRPTYGDELVCAERRSGGRYGRAARWLDPSGVPGVQDRSRVVATADGDRFLAYRFVTPAGEQWAGVVAEGLSGVGSVVLDTHRRGVGDHPWLALGPDGALHAVWEEQAVGELNTSIRHAVCTSGDLACADRAAWVVDPVPVDDAAGPDPRAARRPEVAVAANGAVLVSWVDEGADQAVRAAWACPGGSFSVESPTPRVGGVGHRAGHPMLFVDEENGTANVVFQTEEVDLRTVTWSARPLPTCP